MTVSISAPITRIQRVAMPLPVAPIARDEIDRVRPHLSPGTVSYLVDMLDQFDSKRQGALARKYRERVEAQVGATERGEFSGSVEAAANAGLREWREEMVRHDLVLTGSDADLKGWAKVRASECADIIATDETGPARRLRKKSGGVWGEWRQVRNCSPLRALRQCVQVVERYGIDLGRGFAMYVQQLHVLGVEVAGADKMHSFFARCCSWEWWLRRARRLQAVAMESYARRRGFVHAQGDAYISNFSYRRRQRQLERNARALESRMAESSDGMECLLSDLAAMGLANPENRFAEMVTRARGFEEVAIGRGHCAEFWTMTTPSRFHRKTAKKQEGGGVLVLDNDKWQVQQLNAKEGQQWLCKRWSLMRAAFERAGIRFYGTRVAEPHHDGTPHWHLVLHFHPEEVARAREIAWHYMFADDGTEWGAVDHRFDIKAHDPAKGSAVAYLLKYLFKNMPGLDGKGAKMDEVEALLIEAGAERVAAWAATWGIRQFQFVGGPSVTVWRELRRVMNQQAEAVQGDLFDGMPQVRQAAEAADAGSWCAFVEAMGGPTLPRKARPIKPGYWHRDTVSPVTGGTIPARETTRYGEKTRGRLLGLVAVKLGEFGAFMERVTTRLHDWVIRAIPKVEQPLGGWSGFEAAQPAPS